MTPAAEEYGEKTENFDSTWLEEFLAYLDGRGYAASTGIAYAESIRDFERRMEVTDHSTTTLRSIDRYANRLALDGLAVNTRRRRLHALRSFYGFLFSRGLIAADPTRELKVPRPKTTSSPVVLTPSEVERLIFGFSPPPPARQRREPLNNFERRVRLHPLKVSRDTALLALAYSLALRVSDPGRMLLNDWQASDGRRFLILRGAKRSTEPEIIPVETKAAEAVESYLRLLASSGANRSAALFPSLTRQKEGDFRGLSSDQVRVVLADRLKRLGIQTKQRVTFHALKRSRATHAYVAKTPMLEIQVLLRHASLATTEKYIRIASAAVIQRRNFRNLAWNLRKLGDPVLLGDRD